MPIYCATVQSLIRRVLLWSMHPAIRLLGKVSVRWPWSKRLLSESDKAAIRESLAVGDVLLTRKRGEVSNWLIPGDFYTHAAMVLSPHKYIGEAVDPYVRMIPLELFLEDKDYVLVLRPVYSEHQKEQAVDKFLAQLGSPYDWYFEANVAAMYCSEAIVAAYWDVTGEFLSKPSRILGELTHIPAGFANSDKLRVVCRRPTLA